MRRTATLVVELLAFKGVWLACVVGAARGLPWLGPGALLLGAALHTGWHRPAARVWILVAALSAAGFFIDSAFALSGWLRYASRVPFESMAPVWIVAMWANFALLFANSLGWLHRRPRLGALLGAVGGPGAYLAGRSLGGVTFGAQPWLVLASLALVWAAAVPLCAWLLASLEARERASER